MNGRRTNQPVGGRGRNRRGFGLGPGGYCICAKCKHKVEHPRGVPCFTLTCEKCGSPMIRER